MESNISDFQQYKRKTQKFHENSIEHLRIAAENETVTDDVFINQFFMTSINSIDELEEVFSITEQFRPELQQTLEKRYFNITDESLELSVGQPISRLQSLEQTSDQ